MRQDKLSSVHPRLAPDHNVEDVSARTTSTSSRRASTGSSVDGDAASTSSSVTSTGSRLSAGNAHAAKATNKAQQQRPDFIDYMPPHCSLCLRVGHFWDKHVCRTCGRKGHLHTDCWLARSIKETKAWCNICKKEGGHATEGHFCSFCQKFGHGAIKHASQQVKPGVRAIRIYVGSGCCEHCGGEGHTVKDHTRARTAEERRLAAKRRAIA